MNDDVLQHTLARKVRLLSGLTALAALRVVLVIEAGRRPARVPGT